MLAKQNNAKKSASTIGKRLTECHGYAHIWPLAIKNCNKNEYALTYHRFSENTSHNDPSHVHFFPKAISLSMYGAFLLTLMSVIGMSKCSQIF